MQRKKKIKEKAQFMGQRMQIAYRALVKL